MCNLRPVQRRGPECQHRTTLGRLQQQEQGQRTRQTRPAVSTAGSHFQARVASHHVVFTQVVVSHTLMPCCRNHGMRQLAQETTAAAAQSCTDDRNMCNMQRTPSWLWHHVVSD
jgi:hypothetical protein